MFHRGFPDTPTSAIPSTCSNAAARSYQSSRNICSGLNAPAGTTGLSRWLQSLIGTASDHGRGNECDLNVGRG